MGFGSTAKKLQKVTDTADKLYERFEKLRDQVSDLTGSVEETNERVATLETQIAEQRALLEALAESEGVDVEAVVDDVATSADEAGGNETTADAGADASDGND
jgi:septal ring factor EnvC (AmiA/AmiB activator)